MDFNHSVRSYLNRREFLKLGSLFLLAQNLPSVFSRPAKVAAENDLPNILIILFDTFSATNISLHGYPRETTPHLARIADKAIVYHNHFAGGSWTYPGTNSLLTGSYPWSHRGFYSGRDIVSPYLENNLFSLLDDHHRLAYTHNPKVERVLSQFEDSIDHYEPRHSLYIDNQSWLSKLFGRDFETAALAWERSIKKGETGYTGSIFLSEPYNAVQQARYLQYLEDFPKGPPRILQDEYFLLSDAIDWTQLQTQLMPQPYLAYIHLLPPHAQYTPHRQFIGAFDDVDYEPTKKPRHFMHNKAKEKTLIEWRTAYDEYILNVDHEFGRLYDYLEAKGVLENTWVIMTSDHGEMFERGISGHRQPTFHQPIIRIPLMVLEPGNPTRRDIFSPTVGVDLLPTLLHLSGRPIPNHLEGIVLPPFASEVDRAIYAADAQKNKPLQPLTEATTMIVRWPYKLVYYLGYPELPDGKPVFELFDLENDPEELQNIYAPGSNPSDELTEELLQRMREKDQPYA